MTDWILTAVAILALLYCGGTSGAAVRRANRAIQERRRGTK